MELPSSERGNGTVQNNEVTILSPFHKGTSEIIVYSIQSNEENNVGNVQLSNPVTGAIVTTIPSAISNSPQINNFLTASSSTEDIPPPKPDYYAPPPYEVATQGSKLPTYEEVQREKHLEQQDVPIGTTTTRVRNKDSEVIFKFFMFLSLMSLKHLQFSKNT